MPLIDFISSLLLPYFLELLQNGRKKTLAILGEPRPVEAWRKIDPIQEFVFTERNTEDFFFSIIFSLIHFIHVPYQFYSLSSSPLFSRTRWIKSRKLNFNNAKSSIERYTYETHTCVREFSHQDYRVFRAGHGEGLYLRLGIYRSSRDSSVPILNVHIRSASTRKGGKRGWLDNTQSKGMGKRVTPACT